MVAFWLVIEVCVPELIWNETRLEATSWIAETVKRLLMSGLVARESSGKFGKNLGRDITTQYLSGNSWMVLKWTKIPPGQISKNKFSELTGLV